jgi:signal transduction histidine kinase
VRGNLKLRATDETLRLWWVCEGIEPDLRDALEQVCAVLRVETELPGDDDEADVCFIDPASALHAGAGFAVYGGATPLVFVLDAIPEPDTPEATCVAAGFDVVMRTAACAEFLARAAAARRYRIQRARAKTSELALLQRNREVEDVARQLRWANAETDRAREEALHAQSLAEVGTFAAGVAHQINNPLTGVVGFGELLLIRTDLDEDVVSDLNRMVGEAKRAARIIREMLDLTRTCSRSESIDLNSLLERTLGVPQVAMTLRPIKVVRDFHDPSPFICGDEFRLQQVFQNLLENAAHALETTERDPLIVVRTTLDDRHVRVQISDNGPGVNPHARKKMFEAFFTTKTTRKRRGTGLGLAICRSIAREHAGDIFYEDSDWGGASFVLRFPPLKQNSVRASYRQARRA